MRSNEQLEYALDRALAAAAVPTSSVVWHEELPAARAYSSADADAFDTFEATRSQAAFSQRERAARLASLLAGVPGAGAAPSVRSGAVREQLDAALREVTAVLRRGHDSPHESAPVRLLAVRAAAAGAEQRAAATAARVLAARSESLRRSVRLLEEKRPAAPDSPELCWQRDLGRAEAAAPRQLALAPRVEPARRGAESQASHAGLAHVAGSRRLQALARDGVHNALLKRAARVAAAWDDDED